jgi:hypothetical protein
VKKFGAVQQAPHHHDFQQYEQLRRKTMKNRMKVIAVLSVMVCLMLSAVPALAGSSATVTGEVTETNEIISEDGSAYTIAATEKGDELAAMVGETVKVTGTVQEVEGEKIITVTSFSVVQK